MPFILKKAYLIADIKPFYFGMPLRFKLTYL